MYMTNEEWEQNNQDYLKESYEETGFTTGGWKTCWKMFQQRPTTRQWKS